MAKSMRIQVLIEPEVLTKVKTYAVEHKIQFRNDSQLIRNILYKELGKLRDMELTIYIMKEQLETQKENEKQLISQLDESSKVIMEIRKENEILEKNIKSKVKKDEDSKL
jgi:hypothetical protein